jgi:NHL repeat
MRQGFTLIQISILLVVASLVLVTVLPSTQAKLNNNNASITKMNAILTALRGYEATYGNLPCPADASMPISSTFYGVPIPGGQTTNCWAPTSPVANFIDFTNKVAIGMVPVRALGLSNDYALDAFGRDITYAVDTNATVLGWAASTLTGQIAVNDGGTNNTSVVALISHGPDGHGAWLPLTGSTGRAVRLNTGSTDTDQLVNAHVTAAFANTASSLLPTAESSTTYSTAVKKLATGTFDDLVVYKSNLWNINKIPASVPQVTLFTPPANGTYCPGELLTFTLTYNEAVTVTTTGGTPYISVSAITGNIGSSNVAQAIYLSGSGTNTLTFGYLIASSDFAPTGITVAPNIVMNNGTIMTGSAYSVTAIAPPPMTQVTIGTQQNILYIADTSNNVVRMVNSGGIISTIAGNGTAGFSGDNGPATSAQLNGPTSVAVDSSGNVYIADIGNGRVRMVNSAGTITTFAGNGTNCCFTGNGPLSAVTLNSATGVAVDSFGNVYIADTANDRILKVVITTSTVSIVAGVSGSPGYSGDNGLATSALLNHPQSIAVDNANNLYIADTSNYVIRKVNTAGIITTVAGNGTAGFSGDNGPATSAELNYAMSVAVDISGNFYIADINSLIRKVTVSTGIITTVAGNYGCCGFGGYGGDGGPATAAAAKLNQETGVAVDSFGNIYIADPNNQRIRFVNVSTGIITTVAGNGTAGDTGNNGAATSAEVHSPLGITLSPAQAPDVTGIEWGTGPAACNFSNSTLQYTATASPAMSSQRWDTAVSPDNSLMVATQYGAPTPGITVYSACSKKWVGGNSSVIPGGWSSAADWDYTGTYLAIADQNGIDIYVRSGYTLNKLKNLTSTNPQSLRFINDALIADVGNDNQPLAWQVSGGAFNSIPFPTLPALSFNGQAISTTKFGNYVAVGLQSSPSVVVYKFHTGTPDTFTLLSIPAVPGSYGTNTSDVAFSKDGTRLAAMVSNCGDVPPLLYYINTSTDTFTEDTTLTASNGCLGQLSFSSDNQFLVIGGASALYQWNGTSYTLTSSFYMNQSNNSCPAGIGAQTRW